MKRTTFEFDFHDFEKAENEVKQILRFSGFKQEIVNSEIIWKKGGTFVGGQCLKIDYSENKIVISAWITPFLGGTEEFNLDSITGVLPKKQLLSVIEQIKISLH